MNKIVVDRARLAELCGRWHIREISVFGSAARGQLRPDSDLDLLVSFDRDSEWNLLDVLHVKDELARLFGREVDLVEREAIESSDNWIVKREILSTAENLYASA